MGARLFGYTAVFTTALTPASGVLVRPAASWCRATVNRPRPAGRWQEIPGRVAPGGGRGGNIPLQAPQAAQVGPAARTLAVIWHPLPQCSLSPDSRSPIHSLWAHRAVQSQEPTKATMTDLTTLHIAELDCPRCGGGYLHMTDVIASVGSRHPSEQRSDGTAVHFWCEGCHSGVSPDVLTLTLAEDRGHTDLCWRYTPLPPKTPD
jgi:hypothetical protein